MYNFNYFKEEDFNKIFAFMQANSFVVLTGFDGSNPIATHIPIILTKLNDGKIIAEGHIMRKTDHHLAFEKNENVLVIFNGPHAYISASWYSNHLQASTWNYMAVHARGKIKFTNEDGTYIAIKNITNKYESAESAAAFNKIPQTYIQPLLKAIVGFTIEFDLIENVFKLSQNKDEVSQQKIIEELIKRGDKNALNIAKEIKLRQKK